MKQFLFVVSGLLLGACGAQPYPPTKNFRAHQQEPAPVPVTTKTCDIRFESSMTLEQIAEATHLMRARCNFTEIDVVNKAQLVF